MALVGAGYFEVRADGTIWRKQHRTHIRGRGVECRECEPRRAEHRSTCGYLQIHAMVEGVRFVAAAHRIVFLALVGPIPDGLTVNHLNGTKDDNRPENFELATPSEQSLHARYVLGRGWNAEKSARSSA
jgi:hypothetical protein